MRNTMPCLAAALAVLTAGWATAARAQDNPFKDVPTDHWAYQAITDLQQHGILQGYPDGYFRGKRSLTRYEFAVSLDRMLKNLPSTPGPAGDVGPAGPEGPAGPQGPAGMTPDELSELSRLTAEFKTDLATLGVNVRAVQSRLSRLTARVDALQQRIDHMPVIKGDLFVGMASSLSRHSFYDYSGAFHPGASSLTNSVNVVHDLHLNISMKFKGGASFAVEPVLSNYLSYTDNGKTEQGGIPAANPASSEKEQATLYKAYFTAPVLGGDLVLGRFGEKLTPLTYFRPNHDVYFNLPWYQNFEWIQDGIKYTHKFGSATTQVFAGSYQTVTTTATGVLINQPVAGALFGPRALSSAKVEGAAARGAMPATQVMGLHIDVPIGKVMDLGLTAIDLGGNNVISPTTPFNNVTVYGVNFKLHHIGPVAINGEVAKSVTQASLSTGAVGLSNDDNNAFWLNAAYKLYGANIALGYKYIDPRFQSAGTWDKVGNWFSPTNIQGPYATVSFKLFHKLGVSLGGKFYSGARNRVYGPGLGFTMGSNIGDATAGLTYSCSKKLQFLASYEGVFYNLAGSVSATGTRSHPIEQYITLGANLNLAGSTSLNLAYQIIANSGDGGFGTSGSNANMLTSQVQLKF